MSLSEPDWPTWRFAPAVLGQDDLYLPDDRRPERDELTYTSNKVDKEYKRLYEDIGLRTTIRSPRSSGLLTGKYMNGVPEGSRASLPGYEWLKGMFTDEGRNKKVGDLKIIADEFGISLTQLSLA